jgi:hypothetical protein
LSAVDWPNAAHENKRAKLSPKILLQFIYAFGRHRILHPDFRVDQVDPLWARPSAARVKAKLYPFRLAS